MVEVFYQWILPSTVVLFFLLFWQLRKEYQIQWPVFLSAIVIFPWIVSLWQQRQLVIDLPELSVALILVIIGLFFKIGRWLPVWAIVLLGVAFEFLELCFRQTRFFEWKDVGINLASILGGYCLISGSHALRGAAGKIKFYGTK